MLFHQNHGFQCHAARRWEGLWHICGRKRAAVEDIETGLRPAKEAKTQQGVRTRWQTDSHIWGVNEGMNLTKY